MDAPHGKENKIQVIDCVTLGGGADEAMGFAIDDQIHRSSVPSGEGRNSDNAG
jgi:hypothetical protein